MERKCSKCKRILDISNFHKSSEFGYQFYCKKCKLEKDRERKGIARHGITSPEEATRTSRAYRARYPERYLAFLLIKKAIRHGEIKRTPCEKCGSEKALVHHEDYSKSLQVNWLCRKHHIQRHRSF